MLRNLGCARPDAWRGRLRGCPPPFGLLLDAAAPSTPSARAAYWDGWGYSGGPPSTSQEQVDDVLSAAAYKEAAALGRHGGW
jgi:hypothetical protein